jgi:hypothetical protein
MAHETSERSISQRALNDALDSTFEEAFSSGRLSEFIAFADKHMPPLAATVAVPTIKEETPEGLALRSMDVRLLITREFGIRIFYKDQEVTTNVQNIPADYPWFQPDPADPDDIAGYATRHVARGSRGESPWPENQWPDIGGVRQGEQNWPHRDAAFGPYGMRIDEEQLAKAILLWRGHDASASEPDPYGVIPRGLFTLGPDSSVILALNHLNKSKRDLHWSPWFVLGFAMPKEGTIKNPSVIFAFPDEESGDEVQERMTKIWNYINVSGQKMALINPHAKTLNEPFKKLYRDVNWTVIAMKNSDHVILTRSTLRHEEQFFPFLEHGRYFIEVEHTGPRVAPGQKSTVIVKHDFVPLRIITNGALDRFSDQLGLFEEQVISVLANFIDLQQQGHLVRSYE